MDEQTSTLYDAAVGFMVSERTGNDSWEKVVKAVVAFAKEGKSQTEMRREFAAVEAAIRKDFKVESMPTAWRTAKSTALSGIAAGMTLVSGDTILPKTEVAKTLAACKATPPKSLEDQLVASLINAELKANSLTALTKKGSTNVSILLSRIAARVGTIGIV